MQPPALDHPPDQPALSTERSACDNCGCPVDGAYCSACGQKTASFQRPLHHLGREVVSDYFGFDGKLWRTVVPLLTRPGFLTNEYLSGRRNYYVRPVRLYLTASVALFFLLSVLPDGGFLGSTVEFGDRGASADSVEVGATELDAVEGEIAELEAARASLVATRDSLQEALSVGAVAAEEREAVEADGAADGGFWDRFGELMGEKGGKIGEMGEAGAKEWFIGMFTSQMPKAMFILLPLFALFLKLLYARRERYYGEHLVFALHTHAFAFVIFTMLALFLAMTPDTDGLTGWPSFVINVITLLFVLSVPAYVLLALRRVYAQGWIRTTLKWSMLMSAYNVALVVGIVVVIVIAFLLL